jgi:hypothetical protein
MCSFVVWLKNMTEHVAVRRVREEEGVRGFSGG